MGENHFAPWPVALYGIDLFLSAVAYYVLVRALIAAQGKDSVLAVAIGSDFKGKASRVFYASAILFSFLSTWISCSLYVLVATMWLIPDRRIEEMLRQS